MGTLEEGARNAVRVCMGVAPEENVLIVSDRATSSIGEALRKQASSIVGDERVRLVLLEDLSERPLKKLPEEIRSLASGWANVTFWAAQSLPGELVARKEFLALAKRNARHGHMPDITQKLMEQGMCADYDAVYELTHRIHEIVRNASKMSVSNRFGTDLSVEFNPSWRWIPSDGRYHASGRWGNLPEGEIFTAPAWVNGRLVTNLLGDWFSEKYGNFNEPLSFDVVDSIIQMDTLKCENRTLRGEIERYLSAYPCSARASEFALPTNPLLMRLPTIGNLLQDEKARVHIAFGDPYPDETGATWSCNTHVDMLLEQCNVIVGNDLKLMENGDYLV